MRDFVVKLKISPNSAKNEIITTDDIVKIKLTAQPIENKANKMLVEFLSKTFKIPKTSVIITKGETSKEKTILFKNIEEEKITLIKEKLGVKDV